MWRHLRLFSFLLLPGNCKCLRRPAPRLNFFVSRRRHGPHGVSGTEPRDTPSVLGRTNELSSARYFSEDFAPYRATFEVPVTFP